MASFVARPTVLPVPLALPKNTPAIRVATKCRSVGVRFLNATKGGWGKRELAAWLTGAYRPLTRLGDEPSPVSERRHVAIDPYAALASSAAAPASVRHVSLPADRIRAVVASARLEVLAVLDGLADPDANTELALRALDRGLVVRCVDRDGDVGFLPADLPRLGLADRLASLFVADFLARADDYERELFRCTVCGDVDFDEDAKEAGACFGHLVGEASGVVTRDDLDAIRDRVAANE